MANAPSLRQRPRVSASKAEKISRGGRVKAVGVIKASGSKRKDATLSANARASRIFTAPA